MKIAIFYYSQSGQALQAAQNLCAPLQQAGGHHEVVFKEIKPVEQYPFPWMRHDFFDTFPETRLGLPPSGIQPIDLHDVEDTDMVIIAAQPWFLSPSLPLQSFLADKSIRQYLNGRHVVFLNVCRNMWLMAFRSVKIALQDCGAKLIGHIVLQDEAPNLISALTIVRWLLHGKKTATWLLPAAGVSEKDSRKATNPAKAIRQMEKFRLLIPTHPPSRVQWQWIPVPGLGRPLAGIPKGMPQWLRGGVRCRQMGRRRLP